MHKKVKEAILRDDPTRLQWLLAQEAQSEEETSYLPPLHRAIFHHATHCVPVLIQAGADINMKIPYNGALINAANFAAHLGNTNALLLLIEAGADCSFNANDRERPEITQIYETILARIARARSATAALMSRRFWQHMGLPRDVARLIAFEVWHHRRL